MPALRSFKRLLLVPSCWRMRRAVAAVTRHLAGLGLELQPDKTVIGPIARGFDFPGYRHDCTGFRLSEITPKRQQENLTRLYEQYQCRLWAYRRQLVGQSPIPRPDHDPARAYLNPQPQITSQKDSVQ